MSERRNDIDFDALRRTILLDEGVLSNLPKNMLQRAIWARNALKRERA